jgi:predicted RND superfamily exporter protein
MFSEDLANKQFQEIALEDTAYAAISIMAVLAYFCFHLWSVFLAFMAMLLILLSFGLTAVIYQGLIGVTFYSNLNNLVIFIVLGIAADDFFVLMDAWRQSDTMPELRVTEGEDPELETKKQRMAYAIRRSARAMFVTSSTTCVAFLANVFSPIMPIKAFGIFAAIVIPADFILVCLIFPSLIIFEENVIRPRFNVCCSFKNKLNQRRESNANE